MTGCDQEKPAALVPFTVKMSAEELRWLETIARSHGVSRSDVARMLLHAEADRRGLKDEIAA